MSNHAPTTSYDVYVLTCVSPCMLLQVWYSSAWSLLTLTAFRSAVTAVLAQSTTVGSVNKTRGSSAGLHPEVQRWLQHWQATEVTLAASRAQWMHSQEKTPVWIGSFRRKVSGQHGGVTSCGQHDVRILTFRIQPLQVCTGPSQQRGHAVRLHCHGWLWTRAGFSQRPAAYVVV